MVTRPKLITINKIKTITSNHEIAKALGAFEFKHTANSKTTHFAVPYPSSAVVDELSNFQSLAEHDEPLYAQVDVHLVPDQTFFAWELFLSSYGDLTQILGVLNRPIGLTANDRGLFLRIPEIEPKNRKKAMVFLTSSPTAMMHFLRLDVDAYERGFTSNEEIFEWCLKGGLYIPPQTRDETSNDRQRIRKRDMFTDCMREYYPEHQERLFPPSRKIWTREEVLEEALSTFPHARLIYNDAMTEHLREEFEATVLADMRVVGTTLGANEKEITEVVRGSKRFVNVVDGEWVISGVALRDAVELIPHWMAFITTEPEKSRFLLWLKDHWREVHGRERERMRVGKDLRSTGKGIHSA
jgi:hypothetical protein